MIFSGGKQPAVYVSVSMGMQGKRLMAVFEDDRKYFGLLGLVYGGV